MILFNILQNTRHQNGLTFQAILQFPINISKIDTLNNPISRALTISLPALHPSSWTVISFRELPIKYIQHQSIPAVLWFLD
jgi:hypothetical protein